MGEQGAVSELAKGVRFPTVYGDEDRQVHQDACRGWSKTGSTGRKLRVRMGRIPFRLAIHSEVVMDQY